MKLHLALSLVVASAVAGSTHAGIVYVLPTATGANDGTSWSDAFTNLRTALDTAPIGTEIWVAAGTYVPGPTATIADTFQLKSGVALYGGFAGTETQRTQRDWIANETILSGDVGNDDVYGTAPGQAWWQGWFVNTANSAQVVTGSGVDATAILDGFTISHGDTGPSGTPAYSTEMSGGGMYNESGDPTVRNCKFWRNRAAFGFGGGMFNWNSSPTIEHCSFVENRIHLGSGGGIYNGGTSAPVIDDCTFSGNAVSGGTGGGQGEGGAIMNDGTPPITVRRCTFEFNSAYGFFAVSNYPTFGGAIEYFGDGLRVESCVFRSNVGDQGGAISVWGPATVVDSTFLANVAVYGAGLNDMSYVTHVTNVVNCTFAFNQSSESALEGRLSATVAASNCILWGNTSWSAGVSTRSAQYHANTTVASSCVQGLFQNVAGETTPTAAQAPGCTDANPLFVDENAWDVHVTAGSPCIDTGSNALMLPGVITDLDGFLRVWHVPSGPIGAIVDMGAYEFGSQVPGVCPLILQQPAPAFVLAGGTTTMQVTTAGQAPFTWQWRRNGANLVDGGHVSGATTAVLTITSASSADVGSYDVVVSNSCGTVTSATATLSLIQGPLVTRFCFGDGSATTCPCGNASGDGDDAGCLNSLGNGGTLTTGGTASISNDTLKLETEFLPNGPALFFQGTTRVTGGQGVVFGDGLRCAGGTVTRLAIQTSAGGASVHPDNGQTPISQRTGLVPGNVRTYQVWYRDSGAFCTTATFNLTNGIEVRWGI